MDERTLELMNLVVDGQATAEEQIELHTRLEQSPEEQALFDEMRHFARELDSTPHLPPPPETRETILSAIRSHSSVGERRKVTQFRPRRTLFIAAYAVAAAIILGVALYPVLLNQPGTAVDPADAKGSMTPRNGDGLTAGEDTKEWPELASTGMPDRGASMVVRARGDRLAVDVVVPVGNEVTVRWAGAPLTPLSTPRGARSSEGSVRYPASQNQRSTLIFSAPAGASSGIDFEVLLDGNELLTLSASS